MGNMLSRGARYLVVGACACAMGVGLSGCALSTPSLSEVEHSRPAQAVDDSSLVNAGVLTVALDATDAPQALTQADGSLGGYYVDYARALAAHMGLDVAFVSTASPRSVAEGRADVFMGMQAGGESEDISSASVASQDASALFSSAPDEASSFDVSSLEGSSVAVQAGSASEDALARLDVGVQAKKCANVNECFDALRSGEVEYVMCDATSGGYLARAYSDVHFVGAIDEPRVFSIAVASKEAGLKRAVSSAAQAMSSDGTHDALYGFWYGDAPLLLTDHILEGIEPVHEQSAAEDGEQAQAALDHDLNTLG